MSSPAVIFVCGRNAVRSPMAEALWRETFGTQAEVGSYGVEPASLPDGFMITVMDEIGLDLSNFECQALEDAKSQRVDHVICLAEDLRETAQSFAQSRGVGFECWSIADPTLVQGGREVKLAAYRQARDAIAHQIRLKSGESA